MDRNFFEVIIVGENPKEIISKYDSKKTVEPYIKYYFKDAESLKRKNLIIYKSIIVNPNISNGVKDFYSVEYDKIKNMTDEEAYFYITSDYDYDDENNAITDENPNGYYSVYQSPKLFSVPFITKDGKETFQARKKDIEWEKMHLYGQEIYKRAWEMVIDGSKPQNENEENIYKNMKERTVYFQQFGSKENYVLYSTAFWSYAIADNDSWEELEDNVYQFDWVKNFYDDYIVPLDENDLLTIYECKK